MYEIEKKYKVTTFFTMNENTNFFTSDHRQRNGTRNHLKLEHVVQHREMLEKCQRDQAINSRSFRHFP